MTAITGKFRARGIKDGVWEVDPPDGDLILLSLESESQPEFWAQLELTRGQLTTMLALNPPANPKRGKARPVLVDLTEEQHRALSPDEEAATLTAKAEQLSAQSWASLRTFHKEIARVAQWGPGPGDVQLVRMVFLAVMGDLRLRAAKEE